MKPTVSIIIIHYKAQTELLACLKSIKQSKTKTPYEIIVADNGRSKEIKKLIKLQFPQVKYFRTYKNLGFGAANNYAAKYARGKYLFFLNPDTRILPKAIDILVKALVQDSSLGIVAPLLLNSQEKIYPLQGTTKLTPLTGIFGVSFINKYFPKNPISQKYWLTSWNKRSKKYVDVVPGTAFLISKSLFNQIKGFDSKFFLYFEEADLCLRVKDLGFKILIHPLARVVHHWAQSTSKVKKSQVKKYFSQSRLYYFKKHYGLVAGYLVNLLISTSPKLLLFISITLIAAFLRLYQINRYLMFIGDFGWFYLSARDFIQTGQIPLVGIASSVPIFRQGAIFTWFLSLSLLIGNFNPVSGAIMTALINLLAIWMSFKVTSKLFNKRLGYLTAIFLSTSPLMVVHSRMPYHTALIFPATVLFLYSLTTIIKNPENKRYYFLTGLSASVLYQLELAAVMLLPLSLAVVYLKKIKLYSKKTRNIFLGFTVGIIPFIIHDLKQRVLLQSAGFFVWTLVKIWESIVSLFSGKLSSSGLDLSLVLNYISRLILPRLPTIAYLLLISFISIFIYQALKAKSAGAKLILIWLITAVIAFLTRGFIAEAYLPLVFLPLAILMAMGFDRLYQYISRLSWLLLAVIILSNVQTTLSQHFFMPYPYGEPLTKKVKLVDYIIEASQGQAYQFIYQGPDKMFEAGDDHYQYLLWWKGRPPVATASLSFTFFQPKENLTGDFDQVQEFDFASVGVKRQ